MAAYPEACVDLEAGEVVLPPAFADDDRIRGVPLLSSDCR
jgi:hypothetical protein